MFLFFRHRNVNDPVVEAFEESTLETLRCRCSEDIWVLPHLYDLPDSWDGFQAIGDFVGPLFVFSWLGARAAFAILSPRIPSGKLTCFDLEEIRDSTIPLELFPFITTPAEIHRVELPLPRRWYPVIDYQVCQNCLECVNFCLFGVYTIGEGHAPLVEQPDQCRDGCPACSRVCPAGAILFPEYDDPVISGRQRRTETKDDLDRLIDEVG